MTDVRKTEPASGREQIVVALFDLFRRSGFDGVSVNDISAATGLGRSSLYHYFPGGKDDMAAAVVDFVRSSLDTQIFAPLRAKAPLERRIDAMLEGVSELYCGGAEPCLIASMLVGHGDDELGRSLGAILAQWVDELTAALKSEGVAARDARARASEAIVQIQGALVLGRALRDKGVFPRALDAVRTLLVAR
jgi:TetR/AcrR family transcriptional regulator, lmrAB and yxaGH operons repressor